ncbi:E3 ubiquitin-protein ligase MARCHF6-like isoform X2 [Oppia nitens]|uniref:E3 ubiquitin-protein ligase MARCHF6-like isoform X2 n=1 Tax=Oppia nitens TaxID=1686743 RepID=UPI0023DCC6D6|nr:E3 ubiquitin-protein ligase MARCHF6-like isoform X2 [Oppia nitens]
MDDNSQSDICRVCRSEALPDKPLFHPCICTGSIKFIHQDCLVQWLKYSEKEFCELCNHRFSFIPIYSPDMPKRLPIRDIISGLFGSLGTAVRYWLHYTLVAVAWLGIVPLTAYRIYRSLFSNTMNSVLTLPLDMFSTENLISDGFYGCCVVTCTLSAFISLIWLREQILRGGGPDWLEQQLNIQNAVPHIQDRDQQNDNNDNNNEQNNDNNDEGIGDENDEEDNIDGGDAEVIDNHNAVNAVANGAAQDWNPGVEWDRAAEELTWERILGLDGSLVFLEHVFWVISLNTLFIVIFAFCPYHIGNFIITKLNFDTVISTTHFDGFVTTLTGYLAVGIILVTFHAFASITRFRRTERFLGLCYVVVKVSLLSVLEIGVFPLVCGWWLDICSLPMLDATIQNRITSFRIAPGTSMFIHWLVGMVYVFYFASFILLLREVLRPGVLWFLQNLNDPDFNPIQEMIHLPIIGHIRRFLASLVIFGTTVLLMIWFPVCVVQKLIPDFLPYNVVLSNESPVSELSLEFLLLQLVLPALLDHGHLRQWLKMLVRGWCLVVSYLLDIRSYLLGDIQPNEEQNEENDENLQLNGQNRNDFVRMGFIRPDFFSLRILLLLLLTSISLLLGGLFVLTVPVIVGRRLIGLWMGSIKVHELNTAACGLYVGLVATRVTTLLCSWIPRGWSAILRKIKEWVAITLKALIAAFILLGLIPLLIGLLFDVVIIIPLRVPLNQTPIFYLWQDWAFGVLHTKVICGIAMMGEWRLREVLEEIYHGGLAHINLRLIMMRLAMPVIVALVLILALPYITVNSILPMFGVTFEMQNIMNRRIHPLLLLSTCIIYLIHWQIHKFYRLYEHIKNDKYLVGRRLVNYEPNSHKYRPNNTPHN